MVLSTIRSSKTVARGYQRPTQMVASTSMMRRGCVCQRSRKSPVMTDVPSKRLFTDTDMHDKTMKDEIEDFYNYLQQVLRNDRLSIPSKSYDLVLDIMVAENEEQEKRISWSYYYACHETRCLFWLETYDAISGFFGVKSPAHVSTLHLSPSTFSVVSTNVQSIAWSPFFGGSAISYWIGVVSADIVGIGIIGHSFQSSLEIAIFHLMLMTSLLES